MKNNDFNIQTPVSNLPDGDTLQPAEYSKDELNKLKVFIETVKNDDSRAALACWGNHDNYSKGY